MAATAPTGPGTVMPAVFTVPQAAADTAALLGWSRRSAYRALEVDALPHPRIGRRIAMPTAKLLNEFGPAFDAFAQATLRTPATARPPVRLLDPV